MNLIINQLIIDQDGTRLPTLGDDCQAMALKRARLGALGSKAAAYRASLGGVSSLGGASLALLVWVEDSFRI